jgi:hypothetical protein
MAVPPEYQGNCTGPSLLIKVNRLFHSHKGGCQDSFPPDFFLMEISKSLLSDTYMEESKGGQNTV